MRGAGHFPAIPPTHSPTRLPTSLSMAALQALPRHMLTPFYTSNNAQDWSGLLRSMPRKLQDSVLGVCDRTAQPTDAWSPGQSTLLSLQDAVRQLLDFIGNTLQDIAVLMSADPLAGGDAERLAPGHEALATPLGKEPTLEQCCMVPDEAIVRNTRHINFDKSHAYVLVKVARRPKRLGGWLQERAHRIILWAMHGPPPAGLCRPVAMHLCHNRRCINPQHLVWGEDRENRRRKVHADAAAERRLRQQGRYIR